MSFINGCVSLIVGNALFKSLVSSTTLISSFVTLSLEEVVPDSWFLFIVTVIGKFQAEVGARVIIPSFTQSLATSITLGCNL